MIKKFYVTLLGTTTQAMKVMSNGNEKVLHIPQSFRTWNPTIT